MAKYLATVDGYIGRRPGYIKKGTVFDFDGKPAKWMKLVSAASAAAPAGPAKPLTPAEKKAAEKAAKEAAKHPESPAGGVVQPSGSGDEEVI